jgi:hypothetical protein
MPIKICGSRASSILERRARAILAELLLVSDGVFEYAISVLPIVLGSAASPRVFRYGYIHGAVHITYLDR